MAQNRQKSPKIAENLQIVKLWVCIRMRFDVLIPKMTSFLNFDHRKGPKMAKKRRKSPRKFHMVI